MSSQVPGSTAVGPALSWSMPVLADCFTARPQTGPGLLNTYPAGQWLVLTEPATPARPAHDWPGGTGKTQLAVHLAQSWRQQSQAGLLIWLTATSRDSVLSGYLQAAIGQAGTVPADDAETAAARFLSWLAETTQLWLVVLDGVTDPADLDGLWPQGPAGQVLVTAAQNPAVAGAWDPLVFPVGPFSSHEALTYLMARLRADIDQRLGGVDLVADLGGDPLALAQASAAITSSAITCRDYRDLFLRRREQIAEAAGVLPAAKAVTWTLSVDRADQLSPGGLAQSCLALAVLLGCSGIPETVFATRAAAEFITGRHGSLAGPGDSRAALLSLRSTGLVDIDPGGAARMVRVHPAVRAAVSSAMPDDMRDQAARAAADALLQVWPDEPDQSPLAAAFRASAASLAQASADALWAGGAHPVLFRAGQSLDEARLSGPAVSHWRAVARTSEQVLGPAHPDTLLATTRLAAAALAAGQGSDAVALYRRTLDTLTGSLGPGHPRTVAAQVDVGSALVTSGRPGEAITLLEAALAAAERHGPGTMDSLAVQDSLASAYAATGRHADAIKLARRTLAEREREHGVDHPATMATRASLASTCLANGRPREAIGYAKRTLADRERVLGHDHPDTLAALSTLAAAAYSARRLKEAVPLYERMLADQSRLHGTDHLDTITARGNLASVYHSAGRLAAAIQLYEQTLAGRQQVLGPVHPDTLASRANLAHAYYEVGRLTEAVALLRHTFADCERVLGPDDPLTRTTRESLQTMADD